MHLRFCRLGILVTVTGLLGIATGLAGLHGTGCSGGAGSGGISNVAPANVSACETTAPFSVSPIAITDISTTLEINRLGNLNPPGHTFPTDHMYFYIKDSDPTTQVVDNVPVYAPAAMVVTVIASSTQESSGKTDYSLTYFVCNSLKGTFGHVATLSDKLAAAFTAASGSCTTYDPGSGNYTNCSRAVNVSLAAGEQLGTAGGPTTPSLGLDVGLFDANKAPLIFANNARLDSSSSGFDSFHVACFIEYTTPDLKTALQQKIHRAAGEAPTCGSYNQDVVKTAQGKWYLAGTATPALSSEANHLTLGIDTYNSGLGSFSIGNASVGTGVYTFTPSHSGSRNRNFPEVSADGALYCYEGLSKAGVIFLVQMPSSTTLKIEKQSAEHCPESPEFTGAALIFER
jgi:hypothetical protein